MSLLFSVLGIYNFVEQAAHEMHKGAFDRALGYLNRAIRVSLILPTYFVKKLCLYCPFH